MLCACALSNQIFYLRAASFQNSSKGMTNDEHFSTSSLAEEATVIEKWHELNLQWKRTSHVTTMSKCQWFYSWCLPTSLILSSLHHSAILGVVLDQELIPHLNTWLDLVGCCDCVNCSFFPFTLLNASLAVVRAYVSDGISYCCVICMDLHLWCIQQLESTARLIDACQSFVTRSIAMVIFFN